MSEITAADLEYVDSPEYLRLRLEQVEALVDITEPVLQMARRFFDKRSDTLDSIVCRALEDTLNIIDEWHDTRGR